MIKVFLKYLRVYMSKFFIESRENILEKAALSNGSFQSTSHIAEFFHQCLYQLDDYKNMKAKLIEEVEEV
jgi:hypothetical protein